MNDNGKYFDENFIITLTIEGTPYEDVEVKVNNPHKTIRKQIDSIIKVFELPKIDKGANFIQYELKQIIYNESKDLDLEDEDGRELTFLDYNLRPGDHLLLVSVPLAGRPAITVILQSGLNGFKSQKIEMMAFKVWPIEWSILVGDFIREVISMFSLPLFDHSFQIKYSLHIGPGIDSIICDTNSPLNEYVGLMVNEDINSSVIQTSNLNIYLHATKSSHRNMIGSLLERWSNYKRRLIIRNYLLT